MGHGATCDMESATYPAHPPGRLARFGHELRQQAKGSKGESTSRPRGARQAKERIMPKKSEPEPKSDEPEKKPYEATQAEVEAIAAYLAARRGPPRLKVEMRQGMARTTVDHPDERVGTLALMQAIGTTDFDFFNGLIGHLINASREKEASEAGTNFMLAVIKGIEPRDQVEARLAAQMAAVHMTSMTLARRLSHTETIPQQDSASNAFNKLTRTFATQMEALKRYRSGGEQKVTVQHVHVSEGGQAIVGNVNASTEGVGRAKKSEDQSCALGYAPGVEMPRQIEAEREAAPGAGG
jgi:hypothetical protein